MIYRIEEVNTVSSPKSITKWETVLVYDTESGVHFFQELYFTTDIHRIPVGRVQSSTTSSGHCYETEKVVGDSSLLEAVPGVLWSVSDNDSSFEETLNADVSGEDLSYMSSFLRGLFHQLCGNRDVLLDENTIGVIFA